MNIDTALLGLAIPVLGALVATTWKSASTAQSLLDAKNAAEKRAEELEAKVDQLAGLPQRVAQLEDLARQLPKTIERVAVLEAARHFSKEMHAVTRELVRGSRPDTDEE